MSFEEAAQKTQRGYRLATLMSLVLAPLLVLASAAVLFTALRNADANEVAVERSYQTREQILRVFSLLQDAETGQRGFVITGRETFLEPYTDAQAKIDAQMSTLSELFAADPRQTRRLQTLNAQITTKMGFMETSIRARRQQGQEAATGQVLSERGKRAMDGIRVTIDQMIKAESDSLASRLKASRQATQQVQLVSGLLIALLLGSLLSAAVLINRHTRARQALLDRIQQQSARQAAIFEGAMDAIITLNPSGTVETVNPAGERMFGYQRDELLRRDISLLMDLAPGEGTFLDRLSMTQTPGVAREITARRKDGSSFDAEIAMGAMPQNDGIHMVAAIRDVTERKAAERLKEQFVSTVSHELRTPLTSIAGALGLMESGAVGAMPEKAGRLIYIAKASSERLVRLINDLLDVEKIASGQVHFDMQPVDLRVAANRAVEGVQGMAGERQVTVRLDAPTDEVIVRGDMDRLIQVFTNLLSNAIKFSPDGEAVDLVLASRDGRARVLVRDRGPGVPESFRANIFGKFAQADGSSARAKGGTGLGLAITKEIVERHNGRIRLVSPPSEGAVFEVELPQVAEGAVRAQDGKLRLLIVEDDAHAAEVLAGCLERDGFAADRAATMKEAEAAVARTAYAALLLDLNLPDGDGLSLLQKLREDAATAHLPVVVITGDARDPKAVNGGLAIADWIQKPVDPLRLSQSIRAALPGRTDLCILHVDDDHDLTEVVAAALEGAGEIRTASSKRAARRLIAQKRFDLVVLDVGLPDGSGLDLLADIAAADPRPSVIVYSGQEIEPGLLGEVDAVLTKSRTSFETLVATVRKLTAREVA